MKNNNDNDNFLIFFSCSIILHLLVIYCFLFELPSFLIRIPEEQILIFEMLPVLDKSNVPTQKLQHEKLTTHVEAKQVQQSEPDIVKEKTLVKEQQVTAEKPLVKEKTLVKEQQVTAEKPLVKEKTLVKLDTPKLQKVKKKIPNQSGLDSLLKDLEQLSERANIKSNKQARVQQTNKNPKLKGGTYDEDLSLSISERALIKYKIEDNWIIPIGLQDLDQTIITLYIALNKDGSVREARIKDVIGSSSSNVRKTLEDSALRAVWQASPIENLNPQRYNIWQEFYFNFDLSKM